MQITLYKNHSERICLTKVIDTALVLTGTLRSQTSVKAPIVTMAGDETVPFYNYAFIEEFNRYYYITDIKSIRTGIWELSLLCDVLMSFSVDILNAYAVIENTQETDISKYLSSDIWTNTVKDKTDIINFSGSSLLSSGEYILITAGG